MAEGTTDIAAMSFEEALRRITDFLGRVGALSGGGVHPEVTARVAAAVEAFDKALGDDLNTAAGLGEVFDLIRPLNHAMDTKQGGGAQAPRIPGEGGVAFCREERAQVLRGVGGLRAVGKQLESGDVPLDDSIALYERGEALRKACQARLDQAQARIEKIVAGADGAPTGTVPFDAGG